VGPVISAHGFGVDDEQQGDETREQMNGDEGAIDSVRDTTRFRLVVVDSESEGAGDGGSGRHADELELNVPRLLAFLAVGLGRVGACGPEEAEVRVGSLR